jgi:hypothetical protein
MKFFWLTVLMACCLATKAEVRFGEKTIVRAATVDEGRAILGKSDDFTRAMSSFDRSGRMKTTNEVSEADFLKFAETNVLEFKAEEISVLEKTLQALKPKIEPLKTPLPELMLIVKTTGNEDANGPYVRGNAIILPEGSFHDVQQEQMEHAISHEMFHFVTGNSPALREKLYALIGFHKCAELKFPPSLMRLTTADAPHNDHYIEVAANGGKFKGIPITTARPQKYDPKKPGDFYSYLRFKLLVIELEGDTPKYNPAKLMMTDTRGLKSFHDQVGDNTEYVLHPEEILAENFALLVKGEKDAKTPELLAKMRETLAAGAP